MLILKDVNYMYSMKIYLYIFHENNFQTLEIICLISTLYIIISLTSLHCFYYVVLMLAIDNTSLIL